MPGIEITQTRSKPFLVFGKPDITEKEMIAVENVLKTRWLSTGLVCQEFQKEFEMFIGDGYAIPVSSCTIGLILSLMACDISEGSEVIIPTMTFCATANAVLSVGAIPIFVDCDSSGHIDVKEIEDQITNSTRAIIPVHYTGSACDMESILSIAKEYEIKVIEDAAHAFDGYYYDSKGHKSKIGTIGDFTCFSFYPTKNITSGEGGMVVTKNPELAEKIKVMSMNGLSANAWRRYGSGPISRYEVSYIGQKGNMSDIHAAIGLTQLRRWEEMKKIRSSIWNIYEKAFGEKEKGHSTHLYTIMSDNRDELREYLHKNGIGTGIHFNPLHLEPAYDFMGYKKGDFPVSENIGEKTLSLPISSTMTNEDAEYVVNAVKAFERSLPF